MIQIFKNFLMIQLRCLRTVKMSQSHSLIVLLKVKPVTNGEVMAPVAMDMVTMVMAVAGETILIITMTKEIKN